MKTCILAILCSVFLFSDAFAQSISGTSGVFTHGGSVIISGSSFGTHADYHTASNSGIAFAWEDFENVSSFVNQGSTTGGFVVDCNDSDCHQDWILSGSGNKTNSAKWAKRVDLHDEFACNVDGMKKPYGSAASYSDVVFVSFWFRIPATASSGKFYRQWGGNSGGDTSIFWSATGGPDGFDFRGDDDLGNGPTPGGTQFSTSAWQRVDFLQNGAALKAWIVGTNSNNSYWNWNTGQARNNYFQAVIGSGKDYGEAATDYYGYDDIYISFTQARVEICDTNTWPARTHCEIQIPTSWSSSSIEIRVNSGSFGSSDLAYLYVIDSAGAASSGYAVQFGEGGETPAVRKLNNVTGVRVTLH